MTATDMIELLIVCFAVLGAIGVYRTAQRQPLNFTKTLGATTILCVVVVLFALAVAEESGPDDAAVSTLAIVGVVALGVALVARYVRPGK